MKHLGRGTDQIAARDGRVLKVVWLLLVTFNLVGCDTTSGGSGGAAGISGIGGGSGASGADAGGSGGNTGILTFLRPSSVIGSGSDAGSASRSSGGIGSGTGGAGAGGALPQCTSIAPSGSAPATPVCGDGFLAVTEECDDDNSSDADACSSLCKVTPELVDPRLPSTGVLPLPSRLLGSSRHPLAAGCNAVGVSFIDQTNAPAALKLSTYSNAGVLSKTLQYGSSSVDFPDPAVAALPGDKFVIAWTDLGADGDELGIQLRQIDPEKTEQEPPIVANAGTAFSQSAPDIAFDGNEIVVAWMDSADPDTAPDLRYRLFAPDLTPLGGDQTLAQSSAVEGDVALAASNGRWAAAWRSDAAGMETIEVQSGALHWSVGPFLPGMSGDRPDLTFLDATHLALAFTMGTDPSGTGIANVSRLRGAILDAAAPGAVSSFAISPALGPYAALPSLDQSQPALTLFPDHLLVSWRSGALPGDAKDSELWSRRIPFTATPDSVTVDLTHTEFPLVRVDAQRAGDQSAFRVLATNLWPSGGLVAAWTDHGRSFHDAAGAPDVALQFSPDLVERVPPVITDLAVAAGLRQNLLSFVAPPAADNVLILVKTGDCAFSADPVGSETKGTAVGNAVVLMNDSLTADMASTNVTVGGVTTTVAFDYANVKVTHASLTAHQLYCYKLYARAGTMLDGNDSPGRPMHSGTPNAGGSTEPVFVNGFGSLGLSQASPSPDTAAAFYVNSAGKLLTVSAADGSRIFAPYTLSSGVKSISPCVTLPGDPAKTLFTNSLSGDTFAIWASGPSAGSLRWSTAGVDYDSASSGRQALGDALYSSVGFYIAQSPRVFVGTHNMSGRQNRLFALNATTGACVWVFNGTCAGATGTSNLGQISAPPVVDSGHNRIFFGSTKLLTGPTVWALDPQDTPAGSRVLWSRDVGDTNSWVTFSDTSLTSLYVSTNAGRIYKLDPATGSTCWGSTSDGCGTSTGSEQFFCTDPEVNARTTSCSNGSAIVSGIQPIFGSAVPSFKNLIFTTADGYVHNVSSSGVQRWSTQIPGATAPLGMWWINQASGGAVYVGSNVGLVYELSMSTGAITGTRDVGGASVTMGAPSGDSFTNRLYVTTSEGNFYAFAEPF